MSQPTTPMTSPPRGARAALSEPEPTASNPPGRRRWLVPAVVALTVTTLAGAVYVGVLLNQISAREGRLADTVTQVCAGGGAGARELNAGGAAGACEQAKQAQTDPVPGPIGPSGADGHRGEQGVPGVPGLPGAVGQPGERGERGAQGVGISSVTGPRSNSGGRCVITVTLRDPADASSDTFALIVPAELCGRDDPAPPASSRPSSTPTPTG